MAAPRKASQDSDSSDEDLERFREATWEPPGSVKRTVQCPENSASPVVPSLRVRPDSHEHDGNELQTTPEFRTHVARKLAAMLDTCIKEIPGGNSFKQKSTAASDSEDEGFRLLTTSVPGDLGKILPCPTLKRRAASSTSEDSEEEKQRRCREAAVSGLDILRHGALQTGPVEIMDTTNSTQPKKKKKKKRKKERRSSDEIKTNEQTVEPESKLNGFKKKKKMQRGMSDETQSDDQTSHLESEKESKKDKTGSDCHNKPETVKDGSTKIKKEMGLSYETASDQNINPISGKSQTKKKKKKLVVESCDKHDM